MEKHDIFSNLKTDLENILRQGAKKLFAYQLKLKKITENQNINE